MADKGEIQRDLEVLASELKRLEAEYNMFFAGRLPRPPWETRGRVEALIKRWDRGYIQSSVHRFRFSNLQARFTKFADLWDRGLRAREEGRPGPFMHHSAQAQTARAQRDAGFLHATSLSDPTKEMDKVHALYDSLMDARRAHGEDVIPFHRFAGLVKDQVNRLRDKGNPQVAFRVAVKDGKVNLTVKGTKGSKR